MKTDLENYKNIDKSTHCIFTEKDTFKVLQFNNLLDTNELFKIKLENNYIQLFFDHHPKHTCLVQHIFLDMDGW